MGRVGRCAWAKAAVGTPAVVRAVRLALPSSGAGLAALICRRTFAAVDRVVATWRVAKLARASRVNPAPPRKLKPPPVRAQRAAYIARLRASLAQEVALARPVT